MATAKHGLAGPGAATAKQFRADRGTATAVFGKATQRQSKAKRIAAAKLSHAKQRQSDPMQSYAKA